MRHLTRQNNGVAHPLLHVDILDTEECKGTNILFSDTTGKFVNKSVYTLLHLTLKNTPRSFDVLTDLVAAYYRRPIIGCTLSLCRAKRVNDLTRKNEKHLAFLQVLAPLHFARNIKLNTQRR